jgi:cytochrome c oxidase assembly protein subunit 11
MVSQLCSLSVLCKSLFRYNLHSRISGCTLFSTNALRLSSSLLQSRTLLSRVKWTQTRSNVANYISVRRFAVDPQKAREAKRLRSAVSYIVACGLFMLGAAYAGVPLYRMICQQTGFAGEVKKGHDATKVEAMKPVQSRILRVRFNADTASSMQWNFKPHQAEIKLTPGETALAFYKAKNPTDKPIVGISTYNVIPFEAGQYFNKIQCFCFEEQRLNPHEEVDMPVFFYIDPEFCDDPKMEKVDMITLSYTFFEAKEGLNLQMPNYFKPHTQSSQ